MTLQETAEQIVSHFAESGIASGLTVTIDPNCPCMPDKYQHHDQLMSLPCPAWVIQADWVQMCACSRHQAYLDVGAEIPE